MNQADLTRLAVESLYLLLLVSAPTLLVSVLIGLLVGLLQAMTQVQENTLSFVPKLVGVSVALVVSGAWMGRELAHFTTQLWTEIPRYFP